MGEMNGESGPLAARLLAAVREAQEELIAHARAGRAVRQGLDGVYQALTAAVIGLHESRLLATPSADEWSMAEVLEHVAEHDAAYAEFRRLGAEHYVEHGLEHALQLWRLRIAADALAYDYEDEL